MKTRILRSISVWTAHGLLRGLAMTKPFPKLILLLFVFVLPKLNFADVVIEGRVVRKIKITNLAAFKDYKFFFMYQNYEYKQGWNPSTQDTVWLEEGKEYITGAKGHEAYISAISISDPNIFVETEETIGGEDIAGKGEISYLVDEYNIQKINAEDGELILKKVQTKKVLRNGSSQKYNKNEFVFGGIHDGPFQFFGINALYFLIPLFAAGLLFMLFILRKKLHSQPA